MFRCVAVGTFSWLGFLLHGFTSAMVVIDGLTSVSLSWEGSEWKCWGGGRRKGLSCFARTGGGFWPMPVLGAGDGIFGLGCLQEVVDDGGSGGGWLWVVVTCRETWDCFFVFCSCEILLHFLVQFLLPSLYCPYWIFFYR